MARVDRGPVQRGEGWTGLGPGAVDGRGRLDFTDSAQEPGPQAGGEKLAPLPGGRDWAAAGGTDTGPPGSLRPA